ncbi:MAG: SDR family NAD(P)-dependent oxidoreductase [Proteobacteria bacterium]|nr:SDR family NAD(P)-dependent oxidoreductase [Pseudomonadota bacterium]
MTEREHKGDVAWVVGASSGIGRALALRLADDGYVVAVSARSEDALAELAGERSLGRIVAVPLDVTKPETVTEAQRWIEDAVGPVALCVLCAGTHKEVSAQDFDAAIFRNLIDVNLMGSVHGLAAILPAMIGRGSGHIAVVSSVAGYRGLPTAAAYGATKASLINMCEALAFDLHGTGVRLQLVNPGFVDTPLTRRNSFPMPFLMTVEDAAERIHRGLRSRKFEIAFPRRFTLWLKLMRILPYALYFPILRRATGG